MPIAISTFIEAIKDTVAAVDEGIQLNVNFLDDRVDYAHRGTAGAFMSRSELDECGDGPALQAVAKEMAGLVAMLGNERCSSNPS